ncbi:hypothetical protein K9M79_07600, partial [Candidatus Woesearchaeota archaeon]|nr:hypothetical protein [Candidatus Woesearchaeota archaeon]
KTLTDYIESDASGNIGIGDVTAEDPSTKLDLYTGDLRVRDMAGCSGRLITDGSGIVQCNTDAIVTTETDPEVGDVSSADLWCRSDGASVQCDQPNPTSSGGAPYSMMYLRANAGGTPATCPVDWIEADYTSEYAGSSVTNNVRTCYISDKCSVMYLRANAGGTPATCPVDWIEADYTSEYAGSSLTNNVRTCYVCS